MWTAAVAGTLLGWGGHLLARPFAAERVRVDGTSLVVDDLVAPTWQLVLVLVAMPLIAVAATLVSLHRVQITPLGAGRRARRRPPTARRAIPLAVGLAGVVYLAGVDTTEENDPTLATMGIATPLSILAGLVLAGPWACMWVSRGLARLSGRAPVLIAARRIAADPYTAFRTVGGVAIAAFVATAIAIGAAVESDGEEDHGSALAWTEPEFTYSTDTNIDGFSSGFQLATAFVLFVAACSLTVSVVAGLLERRRPFALLRASGVRLGELRLIALLETAAPLLLTVLGGMATAFVVMFLSLPRAEWALPGPGFFAGAAASVVVTLAVCLVTWPLVDATTRHDNVRYE